MRDSLDFDNDDLEGGLGTPGSKPSNQPPAYDAPRGSNRDASPLPAPVPQKPSPTWPRESMDGETIFAVGEEGDRSDDDDDDDDDEVGGDRSRLVGHSD